MIDFMSTLTGTGCEEGSSCCVKATTKSFPPHLSTRVASSEGSRVLEKKSKSLQKVVERWKEINGNMVELLHVRMAAQGA